MTSSVTFDLARAIHAVGYEDFPQIAIVRAKQLVLDGLGNMLAGSVQDVGPPMLAFIDDVAGSGRCTVAGGRVGTSAPWAALANGTFCRALDFDPPHPGHHPVGANLPASLAIAEQESASGARFLEAFIIGVEVQSRIKLAPDLTPVSPGSTKLHFGRGVPGTMSTAAVAAKLFGLDAQQTRMAFGIASALTGGIESAGTMSNPGDSGNAACRGIQAAMLARRGFTGRPDAIEQKYGYGQFLGVNANLEAITTGFAAPLILVSDSISLKKYPCQYPTHRPIDAIVELYREAPWHPEQVKRIDVEVALMTGDANFNHRTVNNARPADGLDGKFSVHYTAAAAAIDGMVNIDSFTNEKRFSQPMQDMLERIHVVSSPVRPSHNRDLWAEVVISFQDGTRRSRRIGVPRGHAEGQPLSDQERVAKFRDCSLRAVPSTQAERIIEIVDGLEHASDLHELCRQLRPE